MANKTNNENEVIGIVADAVNAVESKGAELTPEDITAILLGNLKLVPGVRVFKEVQRGKDNGREYLNFYVKTRVHGADYPAYLTVASDTSSAGNYEYVKKLFGDESSVDLAAEQYEVKDEKGKVTARGVTLYAVYIDKETGNVDRIKLVPKGAGAKSAVYNLLSMVNIKENLGLHLN